MMKVEKSVVMMGYDNGGVEYDVYMTKDERVFFTKKEGLKIVNEMNEAECFGEYDETNKRFVFCTVPFDGNHKENEELVNEFFEEYNVMLVEFEGQAIEVYEIDDGNWDWFKKEKEGNEMDVQKVTLEIQEYFNGEYGEPIYRKVFYVNLKEMTHDKWKKRAMKELSEYGEGFVYDDTCEYCYSHKYLEDDPNTDFVLYGTFMLEEGKSFDVELGLFKPKK